MKFMLTKSKWTASYGFAIILHPYPGGPKAWTLDILLNNYNYTIWIKGKS